MPSTSVPLEVRLHQRGRHTLGTSKGNTMKLSALSSVGTRLGGHGAAPGRAWAVGAGEGPLCSQQGTGGSVGPEEQECGAPGRRAVQPNPGSAAAKRRPAHRTQP